METGKRFKAVIVEDEDGSRQLLRRLLRRHEDIIEVVGEAASGPEALTTCETHQPDVIFLDLHLPGFDGFELLSQLRVEAHIIITTAVADHAVKAYRANAIDYLLKPIDPVQLKEAIARVASAISDECIVRLLCREHDGVRVVQIEDVLFLCAEDGYTKVQVDGAYHLLSEPLSAIEDRLPKNFVRTHRNAIVNLRKVRALDKTGEIALVGRDSLEVQVSRRHLRDLRRTLMLQK
jgi:two-component system, LytTR family, response regulator